MSHNTASPAQTGEVTVEGALLSTVYGRLVALHLGLATHALPDSDLRRLAMREVMDLLKTIAENPQFRVADAAEQAEFERQHE